MKWQASQAIRWIMQLMSNRRSEFVLFEQIDSTVKLEEYKTQHWDKLVSLWTNKLEFAIQNFTFLNQNVLNFRFQGLSRAEFPL